MLDRYLWGRVDRISPEAPVPVVRVPWNDHVYLKRVLDAGAEGVLVADESAERVIRPLEKLQKRDPSQYVRLRSAAALRQIGPRELE